MKAKFKTWEALQAEGFKRNYSHSKVYAGNAKYPDAEFPGFWVETFLGKECEIVDSDPERGIVYLAVGAGNTITAKSYILEKAPDLLKIRKRTKIKKFSWAKNEIVYTPYNLDFPCGMSTLTHSQAVEVAKWILKVCAK